MLPALRSTLLPRLLRARHIASTVRVGISDPPTARATGDEDSDAQRLAAAAQDMLHVDTDEAAKQAKQYTQDAVHGVEAAVEESVNSVKRTVERVQHAAEQVVSGEALHRATDAIKHAVERAQHIPQDINATLHNMENDPPGSTKHPPPNDL